MKFDTEGKKISLGAFLLFIIVAGCWVLNDIYNLMRSEIIAEDFAAFWASGRLFLNGNNPYSSERLLELQQSVGWTRPNPLVPYYPPWVIPFILPFCLKNYLLGKFYGYYLISA